MDPSSASSTISHFYSDIGSECKRNRRKDQEIIVTLCNKCKYVTWKENPNFKLHIADSTIPGHFKLHIADSTIPGPGIEFTDLSRKKSVWLLNDGCYKINGSDFTVSTIPGIKHKHLLETIIIICKKCKIIDWNEKVLKGLPIRRFSASTYPGLVLKNIKTGQRCELTDRGRYTVIYDGELITCLRDATFEHDHDEEVEKYTAIPAEI